jgi:hypothetical protein
VKCLSFSCSLQQLLVLPTLVSEPVHLNLIILCSCSHDVFARVVVLAMYTATVSEYFPAKNTPDLVVLDMYDCYQRMPGICLSR